MIRIIFGIVLILMGLGCSPFRNNEALPENEGGACTTDGVCAAGLVCNRDGECAPVGSEGTGGPGAECTSDSSCRTALICNSRGQCSQPREIPAGSDARCLADLDCEEGSVCSSSGGCSAEGTDGTTAEGEQCSESTDCRLGLVCGPDETCIALVSWEGGECDPPVDDGVPRVVFKIPRGPSVGEFYTLPYPNDIRRFGTTKDMSGFPGLSAGEVPGTLVNDYVSAYREASLGFGLNETIYFRFEGQVDYDASLKFGLEDEDTFAIVDITPDSPRYGKAPQSRYFATGGGGQFICRNWLGIRPTEGAPLSPGRQYAVLLKKGIQTVDGVPFEAMDDLKVVLSDTPPTEASLEHAWNTFAPLRDFLDSQGMPPDDIIGATVFTTGDPQERIAGVRTSVYEAPSPSLGDITNCEAGTPSPCGAGTIRGCGEPNDNYREFHGRLSLPNFLTGSAPYDLWGGKAEFRGRRPVFQRSESICVSMTIPKAATPAQGWPVAIFAHDVGGHFRTAIKSGLAELLSEQGWVVIGYDGVLHGSRFGLNDSPEAEDVAARLMSLDKPGLLRDQSVQGMSDLHGLVRYLVEGSADERGFSVDPEQIAFIGNGLGAEYGIPFLAYEPNVRAGVLAHTGAGMTDWLRLTRSPLPLDRELMSRLGEERLIAMHPVLQLMQTWLDPRDPQNYGRFFRNPPEGVNRKHLFVMQSIGDNNVPFERVGALAIALNIKIVGDVLETMEGVGRVKSEDLPLRANLANRYTQGLKQYDAGDADASDVLFVHPRATQDLKRFMAELLSDEAPALTAGSN